MRNLFVLPLLLFPSAAAAQGNGLVTGQLVDGFGVGVAGGNLDFFDAATGQEQSNVSNGGTGPGGFFGTTVPFGTYNVLFWPPPSLPLLPKWVNGVVVSGTTNLGVVTLQSGVFLSATFLRPGALPVFGADLDVRVHATGEYVPLQGDSTNVSGFVQVVVPTGVLDVFLDPSGVLGPFLAPWQSLSLSVPANASLGTITLLPGYRVTATVVGNGGPVEDADVDVIPAAGGPKLYTPGDDTDPLGFVDFIVPAGVYDVEFDPPLADRLVASLLPSVSVTATTALGTIALAPGFYLSGTVTAVYGGPLAGVDIDVRDSVTNASVPTPGDDTNASGAYVVVVPAGTWNVRFTPYGAPGYQSVLATAIGVVADTVLNASLPTSACPPTAYGTATPGSGAIPPSLTANNPAFPGNPWFALRIAGGLGGAPAAFLLGLASANLPIVGGTLLVSPVPFLVLFPTLLSGPAGVPGIGEASLPLPIPPSPSLLGGAAFLQGVMFDPGAPQGFAFTNGLVVLVCF